MRPLSAIAAVVILGLLAFLGLRAMGWISYGHTDDSATITIDKEKVKEDTEKAVEKVEQAGKKIVEETSDAVDRAIDRPSDKDRPVESPPTVTP